MVFKRLPFTEACFNVLLSWLWRNCRISNTKTKWYSVPKI